MNIYIMPSSVAYLNIFVNVKTYDKLSPGVDRIYSFCYRPSCQTGTDPAPRTLPGQLERPPPVLSYWEDWLWAPPPSPPPPSSQGYRPTCAPFWSSCPPGFPSRLHTFCRPSCSRCCWPAGDSRRTSGSSRSCSQTPGIHSTYTCNSKGNIYSSFSWECP